MRLVSTVDCWVTIGTSPTATATASGFLPAGTVEYAAVRSGAKVAVIQNAAAGILNITEIV